MSGDSNKSSAKAEAVRNRFNKLATTPKSDTEERTEKVVAENVRSHESSVNEASSSKQTEQKKRGRKKGSLNKSKAKDGDKGKTFTIWVSTESYNKLFQASLDMAAKTGELYSPQRLATEAIVKAYKLKG